MKLMMICGAGMSSSLLANKVTMAIQKRNLDMEAWAISAYEFEKSLGTFDVVLVAPQIRFYLEKFRSAVGPNIPIDVIPNQAYGMMNGDKIVDQALALFAAKNG